MDVRSLLNRLFRTQVQSSREDPRVVLFRDWGLRQESEHLSASFDPFSQKLTPALSQDVAEAGMALATGDLERARTLVRPLALFKRGEQVPYMLELTQALHEVRHFHDQFGTTAGFARVVRSLRDGAAFSEMWHELCKLGHVRLPLAAWAAQPDAPAPLREYAVRRRSFVEWYNLHDGFGLPHSREMTEGNATEGIIVVEMKNLHALLPGVPLNLKRATFNETSDGRSAWISNVGPRRQQIIPVGCGVMMEGNAFCAQRYAVHQLFGVDAEKDLQAWIYNRAPPETQPHLYMAVDQFLTRKLHQFYYHYQVAMTDAALMPSPRQTKPEDHPGVRLQKLANIAAKGPPQHAQPPSKLSAWASSLTQRLGWPNPVSVARQTQQVWQKELGEATAVNFWNEITKAFVSLHLEFLEKRRKTPDILADLSLWFSSLHSLPPPPIVRDNNVLAFIGDKQHLQPFRAWYFFEFFQRHILFGTTLPCAGYFHPHDCPGDPLSVKGWAPLQTCPYSQFLETTAGISKLRVERLRA
jgi:hypothetical protein